MRLLYIVADMTHWKNIYNLYLSFELIKVCGDFTSLVI